MMTLLLQIPLCLVSISVVLADPVCHLGYKFHHFRTGEKRCCVERRCPIGTEAQICEEGDPQSTSCRPCDVNNYQDVETISTDGLPCKGKNPCNTNSGKGPRWPDNEDSRTENRECRCLWEKNYYDPFGNNIHSEECYFCGNNSGYFVDDSGHCVSCDGKVLYDTNYNVACVKDEIVTTHRSEISYPGKASRDYAKTDLPHPTSASVIPDSSKVESGNVPRIYVIIPGVGLLGVFLFVLLLILFIIPRRNKQRKYIGEMKELDDLLYAQYQDSLASDDITSESRGICDVTDQLRNGCSHSHDADDVNEDEMKQDEDDLVISSSETLGRRADEDGASTASVVRSSETTDGDRASVVVRSNETPGRRTDGDGAPECDAAGQVPGRVEENCEDDKLVGADSTATLTETRCQYWESGETAPKAAATPDATEYTGNEDRNMDVSTVLSVDPEPDDIHNNSITGAQGAAATSTAPSVASSTYDLRSDQSRDNNSEQPRISRDGPLGRHGIPPHDSSSATLPPEPLRGPSAVRHTPDQGRTAAPGEDSRLGATEINATVVVTINGNVNNVNVTTTTERVDMLPEHRENEHQDPD